MILPVVSSIDWQSWSISPWIESTICVYKYNSIKCFSCGSRGNIFWIMQWRIHLESLFVNFFVMQNSHSVSLRFVTQILLVSSQQHTFLLSLNDLFKKCWHSNLRSFDKDGIIKTSMNYILKLNWLSGMCWQF